MSLAAICALERKTAMPRRFLSPPSQGGAILGDRSNKTSNARAPDPLDLGRLFNSPARGGAHASDTVNGVPLPDTTGVCQIRDDAGQKKAL